MPTTAPPPPPPGLDLVAIGAALLGPTAGAYAVIVLAAFAGALWALSRAHTPTRSAGALLLLRLVLSAVVLSGAAAWVLEWRTGTPAQPLLAPIAFAIGALGDRWEPLLDALLDAMTQALSARLGLKGRRRDGAGRRRGDEP